MMDRKILAVAAAAAAIGGGLVSTLASSAQAPQGRNVEVVDSRNGAKYEYVDNAPKTKFDRHGNPKQTSIGDEVILVNRLTSKAGGVGRGYYHCTVVQSVPGSAERLPALCTYDFALPDGHLTGSGTTNFFGRQIELPVTGGTGAYAGAHGTLVRIEGPAKQNGGTDTFRLLAP